MATRVTNSSMNIYHGEIPMAVRCSGFFFVEGNRAFVESFQ